MRASMKLHSTGLFSSSALINVTLGKKKPIPISVLQACTQAFPPSQNISNYQKINSNKSILLGSYSLQQWIQLFLMLKVVRVKTYGLI